MHEPGSRQTDRQEEEGGGERFRVRWRRRTKRSHSAYINVILLKFCLSDSHRRTGVHSWFPREGQPAVNTRGTTYRCNTAVWPPPESFHPEPVGQKSDRQTDRPVSPDTPGCQIIYYWDSHGWHYLLCLQLLPDGPDMLLVLRMNVLLLLSEEK